MQDIIALRREMHRHPEAAFTEFFTTAFIAEHLEESGWKIHMGRKIYERERIGVPRETELADALKRAEAAGADPEKLKLMEGGYTGLIAVMDRGPGRVVTLRFDIDCVEVEEENDLAHRSIWPGLMHACGHDGHAAVGLTLAGRLAETPWQGRINLVFQPAEEGVRGGRVFSASSLLSGTDYFLTGHLGITDDTNDTLHTRISRAMSTSKWDIRIHGEAVHAALYPQQGVHALLAASDLVMRLYSIPGLAPGRSTLNVGQLVSGSGRNVVPGEAFLKAETRGRTPRLNEALSRKLLEVCDEVAAKHRVTLETSLAGEAIFAPSSKELMARALPHGKDAGFQVNDSAFPMAGSEDAFYYIKRVHEEGGHGIYLIFGTGISSPHHSPRFDFNEGVLTKMTAFYLSFALDLLIT